MYCYHCKDCETGIAVFFVLAYQPKKYCLDRTCAICFECFEASKHEGHDYRLVNSEA